MGFSFSQPHYFQFIVEYRRALRGRSVAILENDRWFNKFLIFKFNQNTKLFIFNFEICCHRLEYFSILLIYPA